MANKKNRHVEHQQLLRLYTKEVSKLQISKQLGISRNTAQKYSACSLNTSRLIELSDEDLGNLFGTTPIDIRDRE